MSSADNIIRRALVLGATLAVTAAGAPASAAASAPLDRCDRDGVLVRQGVTPEVRVELLTLGCGQMGIFKIPQEGPAETYPEAPAEAAAKDRAARAARRAKRCRRARRGRRAAKARKRCRLALRARSAT